jgi:hypothetical protein
MVTGRRLAVAGSLAVAIGALVIAPACGSGFLDGLSGGTRDAGPTETGAVVDTGADARACTLRRVPEPPPPESETSVKMTVTLAIDALRIDSSASLVGLIPPTSGFDLDNACTCPEAESCLPPPDAGIKKCDGDGGADNALGAMFGSLGGLQPDAFGPDFATRAIRSGSYGALMSIADWNGEANDAKVYVSFFLSQGAEDAIDGGKGVALRMDGTDVWTVDPGSVANGEANLGVDCAKDRTNCIPRYFTQNGYVVDNTVVARVDVPFVLSSSTGRIAIEMNDVAVVAKIEKQGALYRAKGEFVGRWPVQKVLRTLGEVPINDRPLCEDPFYVGVAKSQVCPGADIASLAAGDHKGQVCDAVSTTLRFEGGSAKLGKIFRPDVPDAACPTFDPSCD